MTAFVVNCLKSNYSKQTISCFLIYAVDGCDEVIGVEIRNSMAPA